MNIPDEVIEQATRAGEGNDSDYRVIAEWAIREAARVAENWGEKNEVGGYTRAAFAVAVEIRALAEGELGCES